jgi:ankyrin repeat protein
MKSPDRAIFDDAATAIRGGNVETLKDLLRENPGLAASRPDGIRTLLHVATDWPGHFPNGPAVVTALIESGADVNAPAQGPHAETPLHWAASSDDVAVLDALRWLSGSGGRRGGWWSVGRARRYGRRLRSE